MEQVVVSCIEFFLYAMVAIFAQNAIFARGLGLSRLVYLVEENSLNSCIFSVELFFFQVLCAPLAYFANLWFSSYTHQAMVRPLSYIACMVLVVGLLFGVLYFIKKPWCAQWVRLLPFAAFHSCVLGTLLITTKQDYTLLQSVAFGFGSGVGYALAVGILTEAQEKLKKGNVPEAFKGLPITLMYMGILSLAIYAFTGHTVTI